jgi:hypothetical protein
MKFLITTPYNLVGGYQCFRGTLLYVSSRSCTVIYIYANTTQLLCVYGTYDGRSYEQNYKMTSLNDNGKFAKTIQHFYEVHSVPHSTTNNCMLLFCQV